MLQKPSFAEENFIQVQKQEILDPGLNDAPTATISLELQTVECSKKEE